jgi:hypothetical protein
MQKTINTFRQTFQLMIKFSSTKFNKKTLEAVWVFFVLKQLPTLFTMFRTLQFAAFKTEATSVTMSAFLTDLKTELRRQQESVAQLTATATALAFQQCSSPAKPTSTEKRNLPFCSNGTHNPECTGHSIADCHQLTLPEKLARMAASKFLSDAAIQFKLGRVPPSELLTHSNSVAWAFGHRV